VCHGTLPPWTYCPAVRKWSKFRGSLQTLEGVGWERLLGHVLVKFDMLNDGWIVNSQIQPTASSGDRELTDQAFHQNT
jgi:hypothetical protein